MTAEEFRRTRNMTEKPSTWESTLAAAPNLQLARQETQVHVTEAVDEKEQELPPGAARLSPWGQAQSEEDRQRASLLEVSPDDAQVQVELQRLFEAEMEGGPGAPATAKQRAQTPKAEVAPKGYRKCDGAMDKLYLLKPLLIPSKKLAFCYVSKVACTQMKDLFNNLNGFTSSRHEGFAKDYLLSTTHTFKNINMSEVNKANGWKFAMFVRDPTLRYLSAYSSCCTRNSKNKFEHAFACCGDLAWANTHSGVVSQFQGRVTKDITDGIPYQDMHWGSHADHIRQCGYENFRPENLDYTGILAGDVNGQVKEMLHMVNITTHDKLVDRLFPKGGRAGHQSESYVKAETFYKDNETLEAVKSIYAEDYQLFPQIGCAYSNGAKTI